MSVADKILTKNESLIAEVPVEHRQQLRTNRIGSIIVSDQRVLFLYAVDRSWTQFEEYQLSSEPFAQHRAGELDAVFIPTPDGDAVSELKTEYISKVETETGTTYFTEIVANAGQEPDVDPANCSCTRISSNSVFLEDENQELDAYFDEQEFRLVSCADCYTIYGRYRHGKKASLKKLCSANWLLGGDSTPDPIVELGMDDSYAIHHPPNGSTRVQDAVFTLSQVASRSDDTVSTYKPEYQHALCYVHDDEVVGYLSWENHDRGPILSQLYVRENHRGDGIASALVSGWYETVCESRQYFADELTTGGHAVLTSIDHLGAELTPAQEVYSLTPLTFG